jgi:putative ABC transport system permease protein
MFFNIWKECWHALRRNRTRSLLTMLGIVWGIATVTLLLAYGNGFREKFLTAFEAFGKSAVIVWPGQTSNQAGGERAGREVRFEQEDVDAIRQEAPLVKHICMEVVRHGTAVSYQERNIDALVRGVGHVYGEIRNQVASEGRWLSAEDEGERRRVAFLGGKLRKRLFSGRPAVGETIIIHGVRFTVIGTMDNKLQLSNYFGSDDQSIYIPLSTMADIKDIRYASVLVFSTISPRFEEDAIYQVRQILGRRQRFAPNDQRALTTFGRSEFRPIIDGITIGLQTLLTFIGLLTLGIGGVGVTNIMLVSVEERVREIGLRKALGAKRAHIRLQFLMEAMALTLTAGVIGMGLSWLIAMAVGPLPLLSALFDDDTGKGDLILRVDQRAMLLSAAFLVLTGLLSGWIPAARAAKLDPVEALRYE